MTSMNQVSRIQRSRQLAAKTLLVVALGTSLMLVFGTVAGAADRINMDRTGLAIGGYDPVSYFAAGKPMKGDFQITAEHGGAVYRFVNEESRSKFQKNPGKYLPQYGGYCAYGVSVNAKFAADPTVWKIVDGQLYLNLDQNIAKLFNKDVSGHIDSANENWKSLAEKPAR